MADSFVLDTSAVLTAVERGNRAILRRIDQLGRPSVGSLFVFGELAHRVASATSAAVRADRATTVDFYRKITEPPHRYSLEALARSYGDASAQAATWGMKLGMNDRWIVAEAALQNVQLVTCDNAQFAFAQRFGCAAVFVEQG